MKLKRVSSLNGPQILHIRTIKGKGFTPAEEDPIGYHALGKIEPKKEVDEASPVAPKPPKYQETLETSLDEAKARITTLENA